MISTVIFRSTAIVLCDLAAVTAGGWILWNSSSTSVVSGPVEQQLLFVLVTALFLSIRHTVSRGSDAQTVRTRVVRGTLVTELFLGAAGLIAWQATGIYYLGWLSTFALMFFAIGTGFQLLVDVVTSRSRAVRSGAVRSREASGEQERSQKKSSFANELSRLAGVIGAVIGFAYMSSIHAWDIAFINPLIMMISLTIGLSIVPVVLSHTDVLTRSALADDLDFSSREDDDLRENVTAPRRDATALEEAVTAPVPLSRGDSRARARGIVTGAP